MARVRVGKPEAEIAEISQSVEREGFGLLSIDSVRLATLHGLPPYPDHRDPFDHLLIAQAISEDVTFVSDDRSTPRYPVQFITCPD